MTDQQKDAPGFDARYQAWLKRNPGKSFSDFFDAFHVPKIVAGHRHASLGGNLTTGDRRVSGKGAFRRVRDIYRHVTGAADLPPEATICEVGCGTLRIGAHFIAHHDSGRFAGLDISQGLIDEGRAAFADLVADKRPVLGTFDTSLPVVTRMAPDLVFAFNVVCHVHPDEEQTFYDRLLALSHKPGCVVALQVITHPEAFRYQESGWAKPMQAYLERLAPLTYHPTPDEFIKSTEKAGRMVDSLLLAFTRPANGG